VKEVATKKFLNFGKFIAARSKFLRAIKDARQGLDTPRLTRNLTLGDG